MRLLVLLVIALVLAGCPTQPPIRESGTITGPYPGCRTTALLSEFRHAASLNDLETIRTLLRSGCVNLENRSFRLVEKGISQTRIRVDGLGDLWTINDALR